MTTNSDKSKQIACAFYEGYNAKDLQANFDAYVSHDLVNHSLGGIYDRQAWLD